MYEVSLVHFVKTIRIMSDKDGFFWVLFLVNNFDSFFNVCLCKRTQWWLYHLLSVPAGSAHTDDTNNILLDISVGFSLVWSLSVGQGQCNECGKQLWRRVGFRWALFTKTTLSKVNCVIPNTDYGWKCVFIVDVWK